MRFGRRHAALVVLLAAGVALDAAQNSPPRSVTSALDLYNSGDYTTALAILATMNPRELGRHLSNVTQEADRWIRAGSISEAPRRHLVAAAFALEAAFGSGDDLESVVFLSPQGGRTTVIPEPLTAVIAWACPLSKPLPPSDAEHWWTMASVELLAAHRAWSVLNGTSVQLPQAMPPGVAAAIRDELRQGHLRHAREQFPGEPRWRLVALEQADVEFLSSIRISNSRGPFGSGLFDRAERTDAGIERAAAGDVWPTLQRTLRALEADPDPGLRAAAFLRDTYWHLLRREWAVAIDALDRVEPPDATTRYLAQLFRGWAFQRLNRPADAIEAYQRALDAVPQAHTASTLLASLRYLDGRRVEAYTLLDGAFARKTPVVDPWPHYALSPTDQASKYLARMREALVR